MEQQIIKCAFCKGEGENPHFRSTCPVCKGKRENQVTGKYMACSDCRGSGQKRGTSLTCYTCAGLGVIPDTREELRQARQEIRKIQEEMKEEKAQLTEKQPVIGRKISRRKQKLKELIDEDTEEDSQTWESEKSKFCQSCAQSTKDNDLIKVCIECFGKINKFDSDELKSSPVIDNTLKGNL